MMGPSALPSRVEQITSKEGHGSMATSKEKDAKQLRLRHCVTQWHVHQGAIRHVPGLQSEV
jgi:hypothetical protein